MYIIKNKCGEQAINMKKKKYKSNTTKLDIAKWYQQEQLYQTMEKRIVQSGNNKKHGKYQQRPYAMEMGLHVTNAFSTEAQFSCQTAGDCRATVLVIYM